MHRDLSRVSYYLNVAKDYDQALEICERMIALQPDRSEPWLLKGDVLIKRRSYREAAQAYARAMSLGVHSPPNQQKVYNNYGIALLYTGRYGEALAAFDQGERAVPGRAATAVNRGFVLVRLGRYHDALPYFDAAHQLDPTQMAPLTNSAFALVCLGRLQLAQEGIENVLARQAGNGYAWGARGMLETRYGHQAAALAAFTTALSYQPDYAPTHATFALSQLVRGAIAGACESAERAVTLDPYDARSWYANAQTLRAAGRLEEAAEAERRGAGLLAEQSAQVDAWLQAKAQRGEPTR
ncbi:MAG TPA: tetratricopeptide repeat protein [Ktedonobacterales bacterium]|nr:tetratricopeptide repeat protein [Ktedonobacterales bacterium]